MSGMRNKELPCFSQMFKENLIVSIQHFNPQQQTATINDGHKKSPYCQAQVQVQVLSPNSKSQFQV